MAAKKDLGHPSGRPRNGPGRWRWPSAHQPPAASTRLGQPGAPSAAIDWLPTLLAKGPNRLAQDHLRRVAVEQCVARLHCIVLDTSGSMRRGGRLSLAKGHAALLIEQAARLGDDVALLRFGGQGVELLLPPGRARAAGSLLLRPVGGGGGTPLAEALAQAEQLLQRALRRDGPTECWLWLLTDGRTLEPPQVPKSAQRRVILDFDEPVQGLGRCADWAKQWSAEYHPMASSV